MRRLFLFSLLLSLFSALSLNAFSDADAISEPVTAKLLLETQQLTTGRPTTVAIHFLMQKGWHLYWKGPDDEGMAPEVEWRLPTGYRVTPLSWPIPKKFSIEGIETFGYDDELILLAEITPPNGESGIADIAAKVHWVACDEMNCQPGRAELKTKLTISTAISNNLADQEPFFARARAQLLDGAQGSPEDQVALADTPTTKSVPELDTSETHSPLLIILMAFLGGLILNFMPCVLPVISLKIMSFIKMANERRSVLFQHGMAFTMGVLLSLWTLVAALLILQSFGDEIGWGFQLQEPLFVALLILILFPFSLNMLGLFEWGGGIASAAARAGHKSPKSGLFASFCNGVLATLIATPCSGPFLSAAIGFAMMTTPLLSFTIFTALGLGIAFPYLLISAFPQLLRWMPKPGNWMVLFKEIVGIAMMATVLWLFTIFVEETGTGVLLYSVTGLFLLAIACWGYGKWFRPTASRATRMRAALFAGFTLLLGATSLYQASLPYEEWESFSLSRLKQLQREGKPIFVDFTAKWCLICQANHRVLTSEAVSDTFAKKNIVKIKADWTKKDPEIAEVLKSFGRSSVPLYLYYPKESKEPQILPQLLTEQIVLDAI